MIIYFIFLYFYNKRGKVIILNYKWMKKNVQRRYLMN